MDLNRRNLIKASVAGAICSTLSSKAEVHQSNSSVIDRARLSLEHETFPDFTEVLIIGSGYGGAVAGARLSERFEVTILERGKEYRPGEFPSTSDQLIHSLRTSSNPEGLYDYVVGDDIDILVGSGLGGTSLINANVLIDNENTNFTGNQWPTEIQTEACLSELNESKQYVLNTLGSEKVPNSYSLAKFKHLKSTAKKLGSSVQFKKLDLAVNFTKHENEENDFGVFQRLCTHCGDCVTGCNVGAKNTLDTNFLAKAVDNGAKIYTQMEVTFFERLSSGNYMVSGVLYVEGNASPFKIESKYLFVASGSLGSTALLLRVKEHSNLSFSNSLGTSFSGNGDVLALNYNQDIPVNTMGFGLSPVYSSDYYCGPTITCAAIHRLDNGQEYLIEDAAIPSAILSTVAVAAAVRDGAASVPKIRRKLRDLADINTKGAINHSMVYLGIGHDNSEGSISLKNDGSPHVVWENIHSDSFSDTAFQLMGSHTNIFDGTSIENPRSEWFGGSNFITVHPLGGCRMGSDVSSSVVNYMGKVFNPSSNLFHDGLYVCDGAIIPSSLGVNPMLTIATLSDWIAKKFIEEKTS